MKIEIKSVQTLKSLSQETHCFTAKLYLDGTAFCHVSNTGHGAPNDFQPLKGQKGSEMWARIENQINPWLAENYDRGEYPELTPDLDLVTSILVDDAITLKECKAKFNREIKKVLVLNSEGELLAYNNSFSEKLVPSIKKQLKISEDNILNLMEKAKAFKLYAKLIWDLEVQ